MVTLNPLPGYEAIFIIKKNRGRTFTAHPLPTKVEKTTVYIKINTGDFITNILSRLLHKSEGSYHHLRYHHHACTIFDT